MIIHSKILAGKPKKEFLVRVFIDVPVDTYMVVTVYRTSKIEKYWR